MTSFSCRFLLGAGLCLGLLSPSSVWAQGSAPAMSDIEVIQVQPGRMGNKSASDACGLSSGEVSAQVLALLKKSQMPAYSLMETPQVTLGKLRVELYPEVMTLNPQGIDCISWVSFYLQSRSTLPVPPSRTPRNVTINYWRGGLMVSSTQISHPRVMKEALEKLTGQLAAQYRLDQPPALPNLE